MNAVSHAGLLIHGLDVTRRSYYSDCYVAIGRHSMGELHSIHRLYLELVARDWNKYLGFILGMGGLGLVSTRGRFLEHYYAFMRYADDIADRDASVPGGEHPVEHLERKLRFVRELPTPHDEMERVYLRAVELATQLGFQIHEESDALLSSLLFDARRYGSRNFYPAAELERYYFDRDIFGTGRAMLKALGEDAGKFELLRPLCTATRLHYDICDFTVDVSKGLVNIAREDADRLGVGVGDLHADNPKVKRVFGEHARLGLSLLEQHEQNKHAFNVLCRAVFPGFYVLPCRRSLRRYRAL